LELVSWLCERIWVLQGNFTAEDGYAAAGISIAEMLLTGTTCFLESMVSGSGLENSLSLSDCSSLIGMDLTDSVRRLKRAASVVVWGRLSWTSQLMLKILPGQCILVSWRIEKCRFLVLSKCGRSGIKPLMAGSECGLAQELQEGESLKYFGSIRLTI
jgi:hypothetical protein